MGSHRKDVSPCLIAVGTNLIHDFTAETFSVKLAVFVKNIHFCKFL